MSSPFIHSGEVNSERGGMGMNNRTTQKLGGFLGLVFFFFKT
jgi:hypothetical protein